MSVLREVHLVYRCVEVEDDGELARRKRIEEELSQALIRSFFVFKTVGGTTCMRCCGFGFGSRLFGDSGSSTRFFMTRNLQKKLE
jgi:hypothetical protein